MTDTPKRCSKCGETKARTEFNKRKESSDGLRFSCRACDHLNKQVYKGKLPPSAAPQLPKPEPTASSAPAIGPEVDKIIGRIVPPAGSGVPSAPPAPRIQEVMVDQAEEAEAAAAKEYSDLLNKKLTVRQRANLMVKIARNIQGVNAALALKAINDINLATGVVNKSGAKIDIGPLFVLPEGSDVRMSG